MIQKNTWISYLITTISLFLLLVFQSCKIIVDAAYNVNITNTYINESSYKVVTRDSIIQHQYKSVRKGFLLEQNEATSHGFQFIYRNGGEVNYLSHKKVSFEPTIEEVFSFIEEPIYLISNDSVTEANSEQYNYKNYINKRLIEKRDNIYYFEATIVIKDTYKVGGTYLGMWSELCNKVYCLTN